MSVSYRTAIFILVVGLCCIASSQLIVKWRYAVIGPTIAPGTGILEILLTGLLDRWFWVALLLIGAGVVSWYVALTKLPLTFMFPVAGIVSPTVAIGAHMLLGEPLSMGQLGAVLLIAIGVVLLGLLQ